MSEDLQAHFDTTKVATKTHGNILQRKTWAITLGVFAILALILSLTNHFIYQRSFDEVEHSLVYDCAERLQRALEVSIDQLDRSARDYSTWDDTWNFVIKPNDAYITANLNETVFSNLAINTMAVYTEDARLVSGFTWDKGGKLKPLETKVWSAMISRPSWIADGKKGLVRLPEGLALFTIVPILRSDKSGPSNGYFVVARLLDKEYLANLSAITVLDLKLHELGAVLGNPSEEVLYSSNETIPMAPINNDQLAFHLNLRDIDGNKVAAMHVVLDREIHKEGVKTSYIIFGSILLAGTISCVLFVGLLRVLVIRPLENLNSEVQLIGTRADPTAHVTVRGSDEIAKLADEINQMLCALVRAREQQAQAKRESESLQAQLLQAQKMEAIGTMAGGLAHDFNNMLNSILGSAELLRIELPPNHPIQEHITRIEKAGANASTLVRQLLAVGRKQSLKLEPVHLKVLVQDVMRLLRAGLPKAIDFQFECLSDEDAVMADAAQLHQVIVNLATNSAHALAGRERGLFKITMMKVAVPSHFPETQKLKPGQYLHLVISDNGGGISKENLSRIFEPFFTTKPSGSGSGLGLAVVHGIITKHNGAISVESQKGIGTSFHIHLPLVSVKRSSAQEILPPLRDHKIGGVLLVDDDRLVRDTLSAGLKRFGYTVLCTGNGDEALSYLKTGGQRIDCLITDQVMPGMSGIELGEQARAIQPKLVTVLISGFSEALGNDMASSKGFSRVLAKPVTAPQLHAALQSCWRA